jgi:hypothetical protein
MNRPESVAIAAPSSKNRAGQALHWIELGRGKITISSLCAGACLQTRAAP